MRRVAGIGVAGAGKTPRAIFRADVARLSVVQTVATACSSTSPSHGLQVRPRTIAYSRWLAKPSAAEEHRPMDKSVDPITLEAARRGDRAATVLVLRKLQDVWYRMCLGLLGNPDDASDAVQETALRFLRDLPRFRGESSISTWSLGIAINVTREIRRKSRAIQIGADEHLAAVRSTAGAPDDQASDSEARSLIRSSLEHLSDRQREAVLLRFFEQLSVEETASAMECAQGTVKATVHQALRILKTKLKQLA